MARSIPKSVTALAERLRASGLTLITAESCTGGMIAAALTREPGSSLWFEGAYVTYRLSAKTRMLGVRASTLEAHGAVSEPTAREMVEGALDASGADIGVAVTGVAGPAGGDPVTPVGTVWFAWGDASRTPRVVQTSRHALSGSRDRIRERAVAIALEGLLELLDR